MIDKIPEGSVRLIVIDNKIAWWTKQNQIEAQLQQNIRNYFLTNRTIRLFKSLFKSHSYIKVY